MDLFQRSPSGRLGSPLARGRGCEPSWGRSADIHALWSILRRPLGCIARRRATGAQGFRFHQKSFSLILIGIASLQVVFVFPFDVIVCRMIRIASQDQIRASSEKTYDLPSSCQIIQEGGLLGDISRGFFPP